MSERRMKGGGLWAGQQAIIRRAGGRLVGFRRMKGRGEEEKRKSMGLLGEGAIRPSQSR
uniref:Uncharacterized protein n=1 Tax=Meloidogyne incognita TaxID=6306 RepID=A0A914L232_MELIC